MSSRRAAAMHLRDFIRSEAIGAGFDTVHVASLDATIDYQKPLDAFLAARYHGDMHWLARDPHIRGAPVRLWRKARSALVLGMNYGPNEQDDPLISLDKPHQGTIALYARRRDYHDVIKKKLKSVARKLIARAGGEVKVFVDTAPVMEKPLAQHAGTGWQGKHTNLVSRQFGSWLLLGSIFTTLDIAPDQAHQDHCGTCRRCLDICPTNAFPAPYQLDARRCISYLTIEYKGHIPRNLRAAMGNRIFGCDDCLAVCPWNRFASAARETRLVTRTDLQAPQLRALSRLTDSAFRQHFARTPIKRTGRDRFVRNVLIAIGNSGDAGAIADVMARLDDKADVVRVAAVWALSRLASPLDWKAMMLRYYPHENEDAVRAEWEACAKSLHQNGSIKT